MAYARRTPCIDMERGEVGRKICDMTALLDEGMEVIEGVECEQDAGQTVRGGQSRALKSGNGGCRNPGARSEFRLRQPRTKAKRPDKAAKRFREILGLYQGYGNVSVHCVINYTPKCCNNQDFHCLLQYIAITFLAAVSNLTLPPGITK